MMSSVPVDPDFRLWPKYKRKDLHIYPHIVYESERLLAVITCSPEFKRTVTLNYSAVQYLRHSIKRSVVITASGENQDDAEQPDFATNALAHPIVCVEIDELYEALREVPLRTDQLRFDPTGYYMLVKATCMPTRQAKEKPAKPEKPRPRSLFDDWHNRSR